MSTYSRNISVNVEETNCELMKATAVMENKIDDLHAKEYFKIEMQVSKDTFEIKKIDNVVIEGLFPLCCNVIPKLQHIIGLEIKSGYSKQISELVGGSEGCTHIVELLNEIGRCIYQTHHSSILIKDGFEASYNEYKLRSKVPCLGLSNLNRQEHT